MGPWDYIKAVAVMVAVIFAAYYVTRLAAKTGGAVHNNKQIRQLASLQLARDKSVSIVGIGAHAYVLGVGPQRVELLDKLDLNQLDLTAEQQTEKSRFAESFQNQLCRRLRKPGDKQ